MRAHPRIWLGGCSLLLLSSLAITQLSPLLLPQVHETYEQSERAVQDGQYQMALALMKGTLYSDGVTIGIEGDHAERTATEFVLKLLKKRLFSSPVTPICVRPFNSCAAKQGNSSPSNPMAAALIACASRPICW